MLRTLSSIILFLTIVFTASTAHAASFFFSPKSGEFNLNDEISIDLKINTSEMSINAAQATIRFPHELLTVKSVSKVDSVFNFWLEEPTFSNDTGIISFVGGTPYGISGSAIQTLRVVFSAKSIGNAPITITDGAISASDGNGTNIFDKAVDSIFIISPSRTQEVTTLSPVPVVVTAPVQIKREAVLAAKTPTKPVVKISLYPDQSRWSNDTDIFTAEWELPSDITDVTTTLNKRPTDNPTQSEGLFSSKSFSPLSDGVWYLHVRFKNNVGWGNTTNYRIAVDTKAPLPFEISATETEVSDNPAPIFKFKAEDSLSGISEYRARVDNQNWIIIPKDSHNGEYKLTLQAPGKHQLLVQARDNAENSIENMFEYETLPLPAPTFTFVTTKLFADENAGLSLKGTGLPSSEILVLLKKKGELIASSTTKVDVSGNWSITFADPLRNGTYFATITNKDVRGAISLPVESEEIRVTGKYTTITIVVIVALICMIFGGTWFFKTRRERTALRIRVAESDTSKVFDMMEADIAKLQAAQKTATPADDEFITEKLSAKIAKMRTYIKDEINRAKD